MSAIGTLVGRAILHGRGKSLHDIGATTQGTLSAVIPHGDIRAAFADLLPCWKGRKPRRAAIDRDELAALLLDKSLPPNALRVAGLRALGMPEAQIRAKLRLPKRTYYDAVRILSCRPRR